MSDQTQPDMQPQPTREIDKDLDALSFEIKTIKDNHLKHIGDDITEIKETAKEHHTEFNSRLDKIDARIWTLVIMVTTGLGGIAIQAFFGG